MKSNQAFKEAYDGLNTAQREAVETLDGPVMVVAGPGTGKTQVLALRIANILTKTDTPPSGILCLTFTNAGVAAMRERLLRLIGSRGSEVHVATFHRFGLGLIEKHFAFLGFEQAPTLLGDTEAVALADEILESGEWKHIRPRNDSTKYFGDLKSLISLLKRETISPSDFLAEVDAEIDRIQNDPENISSRGARKGELKKEALTKIESLERTREVVQFYEEYERLKIERAYIDYDDVLAYAVRIAQESEDARADMQENFLYVLVDEHQDSSGVQNAFLEAVWGGVERPNIFVVGDDRQLIYAFGGASLEHFTRFRNLFGAAKEITLIENYRSTQTILDAADALLQSSIAKGKLKSAGKAKEEKLVIFECDYPRDEIIAAAEEMKKKNTAGVPFEDMAILVPKNYQARSAADILREQGIPVSASGTLSFFTQPEAMTVRRILSALADPFDGAPLGELLLDASMGVPPIEAHRFLRENLRKVSLDTLRKHVGGKLPTDPLTRLAARMQDWLECGQSLGIHGLVQKIGEELFFAEPSDHDTLLRQVEVVRTYLHLVTSQQEKHPHMSVADFVAYLNRLEEYGHEIPLAVFSGRGGVRVLTLHGSKGLEYRYVHIAHLDEASLMRGKRLGFVVPERIDALIEAKTEMGARRELYVAITRAKETCTLSYARSSYTGAALTPAPILADLPEDLVVRKTIAETEAEIIGKNPTQFVSRAPQAGKTTYAELAAVVREEYPKLNVSVTLLNNFYECVWKWYFRSMLQLPEKKSESLLLGSAVHTGIEYLIKHRGESSDKILEATVRECLEREYVSSELLMKRVTREALAILLRFKKEWLPKISEDAQSERSVSYRDPKLPHLSCYGKIDLTERATDRVVSVTDFKTGSAKTPSVIEKNDDEGRMSGLFRQLAMYSYLIENAEKGTEVRSSQLLFLEAKADDKNALYEKAVSAEEIDLLRKDIKDYDDLLSSGQWVNRECNATLYGAGSECEYCKKARELYSSSSV